MRKNLYLSTVILSFFSLPFISFGQKVDSLHPKSDSTLIIKRYDHLAKAPKRQPWQIITMNGVTISDSVFKEYLYSFKPSQKQYIRSQRSLVIETSGVVSAYIGVLGLKIASVSILPCVVPLGVGITAITYGDILYHHHLNKAVRLYNEEIFKRNA